MDQTPPLAYDYDPRYGAIPNASAEIAAQPTQGPAYMIPYANNRTPHALQYSLTIQQQVGNNNLFSVGYVGSRGINTVSLRSEREPARFISTEYRSHLVPVGATVRNQPTPPSSISPMTPIPGTTACCFPIRRGSPTAFRHRSHIPGLNPRMNPTAARPEAVFPEAAAVVRTFKTLLP